MRILILNLTVFLAVSCSSKNLATSGLDYKPASYGPQLDERGLRQNFIDRGR
jgi:hypothetical protein